MLTFKTFTCFFFFNDTATTEIYTLSLHDALPICRAPASHGDVLGPGRFDGALRSHGPGGFARGHFDLSEVRRRTDQDRKSTRLNSSHVRISYAVFCLKKKKEPWRQDPHKASIPL